MKVKYRSDSDVSELVITSLAMFPAKFALLRNSDNCYRAMSVFAHESPELEINSLLKVATDDGFTSTLTPNQYIVFNGEINQELITVLGVSLILTFIRR